MSAESIISLVSSVGFPIVACIALFGFMTKTLKDIQTALTNNTMALEKLRLKLGEDEENNGKK